MWTIQDKNQNGQKQDYNSSVIIVLPNFGKDEVRRKRTSDIIAQWFVTPKIEKKIGNPKNSRVGVVGLHPTKLIGGGLRKILNEWHTLRLEDMPESGMQKDSILLKNGKNFAESSNGNAAVVRRKRNLPKTTSNLFRSVEQIISRTSNPFVARVIAGNGKS